MSSRICLNLEKSVYLSGMTNSEGSGNASGRQANEEPEDRPKAGRKRGVSLVGLKRARARSGLTLDEVAARTGLNRSTVNQLENVKRGADIRTTYILARALEVSEEELTGGQ